MAICHYENIKGKRVLIPECYGTALHYPDISFCCCDRKHHNKTIEQRVTELEKQIKELFKQNSYGKD
jgi:hypothetical protein